MQKKWSFSPLEEHFQLGGFSVDDISTVAGKAAELLNDVHSSGSSIITILDQEIQKTHL